MYRGTYERTEITRLRNKLTRAKKRRVLVDVEIKELVDQIEQLESDKQATK